MSQTHNRHLNSQEPNDHDADKESNGLTSDTFNYSPASHRLQTWPMSTHLLHEHHHNIVRPHNRPSAPKHTSATSVNHDVHTVPTFCRQHVRKQLDINLAVINARSVRNKTAPLLHHFLDSKLDICMVTETWIQNEDHVIINQLRNNLVDFKFIPRSNRSGGGTGILFARN
jgi:hypothetical protein